MAGRQLESKLQEAKNKKDTLKARAKSANSAKQINEMVQGLNINNAMTAFERMEEKVMALESESQATAQVRYWLRIWRLPFTDGLGHCCTWCPRHCCADASTSRSCCLVQQSSTEQGCMSSWLLRTTSKPSSSSWRGMMWTRSLQTSRSAPCQARPPRQRGLRSSFQRGALSGMSGLIRLNWC